jgi:hypothetical protein
MITGTSHFVSIEAAERYYQPYGYDNVRETVQQKIREGEISIGKPSIKPGEGLTLIDGGMRYGIVW